MNLEVLSSLLFQMMSLLTCVSLITLKDEVIKIFDNLGNLLYSPSAPKAFTEKGLYMLATILKSPKAVETTIAIVETFAKLKELSRVIVELPNEEHGETQRQSLLQRGSQLVNEILDDTLPKRSSETSFELNLAILKLKHSIKRENDDRIAALEKKIEELTKDKG